MGPLRVCRVVSSHVGGLMASGGRSYGQFGKAGMRCTQGLLAAEQTAQDRATVGMGIADCVAGAGVCCCFKHLKIPFGVFHFLSSICRLTAFRTNETSYRFS